jgi:acyl carrier protein
VYNKELREKIDQFDQEEKDQVFHFIRECLVEMDIDQDEIRMDSLLIPELGMDSIDFLDLTYRLEERYRISIPRNGIRESIRARIPDEEFSKEGIITDDGLELLKEMCGGDCKGRIKPGMSINRLPELFSVETFVQLTVAQLLLKPDSSSVLSMSGN